MASQPPSSGGPNRQPLQTYLGSAVRPQAAAAAPAATQAAPSAVVPVAAPVTRQNTPPQPQLFAAPPAAGAAAPAGVFATPPLFGAPSSLNATPAAGSADLLSSLLDPSPSQTPRQSVSSVFGENASVSPAASQPQQFNYSAANAASSAPSSAPSSAGPGSLSVSTMSPSSSFSQPQPLTSQISVSSSPLGGPSATPAARLEQTFEHPLLGGPPAAVGPSPSPSPGVQGLLGSSPAPTGQSTVLAGPLGPLGPARAAGPALPPRLLQRGSSQPPSSSSDPLNNTAPSPSSAKSPLMSTAAAQAYAATQLQQQQLAQLQQAPQASPDEKLSSLLAALFQGTPPPAKLAAFDVSAVPRNEEGLVALAEKGCWREVVKLAEALLDFKAVDLNASAGKDAAAATTTLAPHTFYRLLHYYLAALVKLKKFDAAYSTAQARLGSCWGADKLYASHPAHYPPSEPSADRVGNMLPFELHLLSCQLVSYLPPAAGSSQPRTRQALDQCMKLLQWLRAMIARKRADENGALPAPGGVGDASSPHSIDKRGSVFLPDGAAGAGAGGGNTLPSTLSSSNPFSLTSPHTLSPLTSAQLTTQLCVARLHVANLCLSWSSSLDVDFEQSLAWLEDLRAEDAAASGNGGQADPAIHECLARVHLQVGDLASATAALQDARKGYEARGEKEHVNIGLHQVLLHLARNDYSAAFALISSLYAQHPSHIDIANQYAVCSLYVPGGIALGIAALEDLIRRDPLANLRDSVVCNLRALYDLSSPNPQLKRRVIEGLILLYGSDELELSS